MTLSILGLVVWSAVHIIEKVEKPTKEAVKRVIEEPPPKPLDPGIGEFDAAMVLIQEGELRSARDKLLYLIRYFPKSDRFADARRICGEINMDLLLTPLPEEGRIDYEVKRGDSLNKITKGTNTTLEYVRRVNRLMDFVIHPGDQFVICELDFEVNVSTRDKRMVLNRKGQFFKEYAITELKLPAGVALPFKTSVSAKSAWNGEKNLMPMDAGYESTVKSLRLSRPGLAIRSLDKTGDGEGDGPSDTGIFMDPLDIDELNLLLPLGNSVSINHDQP